MDHGYMPIYLYSVACIRTRLHFYSQHRDRYLRKYVKRAVNSMDDCFDFMGEPMYGFKVKINYQEICENGECKVDLAEQCNLVDDENCVRRSASGLNRQTGEEFASDGPPDCREISVC